MCDVIWVMRGIHLLSLVALSLPVGCSESASSTASGSPAQARNGEPGKSGKPGKPGKAGQGKPGQGKPGKGKPGGRPALVELAPVVDGQLTDGWTYLGRVEPALATDMAPAVGGHVLSVKVREGDHVAEKKTLLILDSARVRAELAASQAKEQGLSAELDHAKKQFARIAELEYPAVSEPERERFQLDIARLEAQLLAQRAESRRLRVDIDRHSLEAPFAGVVSARHVDPGAWVNAGAPVLSVVSLAELEIHVDVSADLGSRIQVGQSATVRGQSAIPAQIAGIVGVLDSATRTMRVRLLPDERPPWLLSGMAVDVEFAITLDDALVGEGGVLVPRDALVRGPVRTRVIKYQEGQAVPVYVTVLATARGNALVRPAADEPPLAVGDQVVVRGNERLRPGQPLRPKE